MSPNRKPEPFTPYKIPFKEEIESINNSQKMQKGLSVLVGKMREMM